MIGYVCKYTPVEVLAGFGEDVSFLLPEEASHDYADSRVWPSLCGYAKSILESLREGGCAAVVFTDCCDAMKRVCDALVADPALDVAPFTVGLPRACDGAAIGMYARNIVAFIERYGEYSGRTFDVRAFIRACADAGGRGFPDGGVALMGARAPKPLAEAAARLCALPVIDLTCASPERRFPDMSENADGIATDELLRRYAEDLLAQTPCMRMMDDGARRALPHAARAKAIIYHTIQFCDFYGFEYARLPQDVPVLKIETDFTAGSPEQIATRLQAFFENNGILKKSPPAQAHTALPRSGRAHAGGEKRPSPKAGKGRNTVPEKYYAGIDSGSTSTNVAVIDEGSNLVAAVTVPTGANSADAARLAVSSAFEETGRKLGRDFGEKDIAATVATGYGRVSVPFASKDVTEITCHAKGAHRLAPDARTVIDIGGQDSKVIRLGAQGGVAEFSMNDKCAAGTGRFLELMAGTLGMDMSEMARAGLRPRETIDISSMCAVFAESEVISLIARGKSAEDIVWGVDLAIAGRVASMAARLGAEPPYVMTGGVANNEGVVKALGEKLGMGGGRGRVVVPDAPQICGALGAALIALEL